MEAFSFKPCQNNGIVSADIYKRSYLFMRKKILIITPFRPDGIGGAKTFAKELINEVSKQHDIYLVTMKKYFFQWDNPNISQMIVVAWALFIRAFFLRIRYKFDAVHCLGIISTGVGAILKMVFGGKLISTTLAIYNFRGYSKMRQSFLRFVFRFVDVVFVEDNIGLYDITAVVKPLSKKKIFTHWVDLRKFKPRKYSHKKPVILFVGRPIGKKGFHIFNALRNDEVLKQKARFEYVQNVPYENLPKYYQGADIFIIPSVYDEGVARVVLEAAACGLVVVASNKGSLPELVRPFGFIASPSSVSFKRQILRILKMDIDKLKRWSREYAKQNFSNRNAGVFIDEY